MTSSSPFSPGWVSPPSHSIAEYANALGASTDALCTMMELPQDQYRALLDGDAPVTQDLARKLHAVIGGTEEFWLARQKKYDEATRTPTPSMVAWANRDMLSELPYADMVKLGWLPPATGTEEKVAACLEFFREANAFRWLSSTRLRSVRTAFRTANGFASKQASVAAWLMKGEIECEKISCAKWSRVRLQQSLEKLRQLTRQRDPTEFFPALQALCAEVGVAVVGVRAPKGCVTSGAARLVSDEKAMIVLSFRYLSDDQFWFSFFHEVGHLLLHDLSQIFVDEDLAELQDMEHEANVFAADVLVPKTHRADLLRLRLHKNDIVRFARKVGVSPGIVVGQLEHLGRINFRQFRGLKRNYEWSRLQGTIL